ncbi:MAG: hypothetical protein WBD74_07085 [Candidatus Aquilonibacter sp.]
MITGRTYNQFHIPRKYVPGKRRLSVYWAWSYPWEANRDLTHLDNRFSSMTEVRRVAWPNYETEQFSHEMFQQGIAGTLELFHLGVVPFQELAEEMNGIPVAVYQRVDQAGVRLPIDERVLADTDTLLVFGLDHMVTNQEAAPEEIEALREFLKREGTVLLIGPHHDVGATDDFKQRDVEYRHHGDRLVPSQQRFGTYTRGLLKGLGVPVENQWGLRPATVPGTRTPVPVAKATDLDTRGWLDGVTSFVFHQHLPHYAVTGDSKSIHVLARQPVNLERPHPFTAAGNTEFNMFLWMPPSGDRAGDIIIADSTLFVNLFGGDESLRNFWRNIATK